MTTINSLRWQKGFRDKPEHQKFVAERLTAWNLMHFADGGGYDRTPESMLYIFYGTGKEGRERRRNEIQKIACFLAERQEDERKAMVKRATEREWTNPREAGWNSNCILLGDFNIISPEHETMQARRGRILHPTKLHATNLGNDNITTRSRSRPRIPG